MTPNLASVFFLWFLGNNRASAAPTVPAWRPAPALPPSRSPRTRKARTRRTSASKPALPAPSEPSKQEAQTIREMGLKPATKKQLEEVPGKWWELDKPVRPEVAALAAKLLKPLWAELGEGGVTFIVHKASGRVIAFRAEKHGTKKAVSAWRLKEGTVLPAGWPPMYPLDQHPPEEDEEIEEDEEDEDFEEDMGPPEVEEDEEDEPPTAEEIEEAQEALEVVTSLPVLMQGSSGPDVAQLQELLGIGGQRGYFGTMTRDRVIAYQRANGLKVDGIVGPQTWTSLLT